MVTRRYGDLTVELRSTSIGASFAEIGHRRFAPRFLPVSSVVRSAIHSPRFRRLPLPPRSSASSIRVLTCVSLISGTESLVQPAAAVAERGAFLIVAHEGATKADGKGGGPLPASLQEGLQSDVDEKLDRGSPRRRGRRCHLGNGTHTEQCQLSSDEVSSTKTTTYCNY